MNLSMSNWYFKEFDAVQFSVMGIAVVFVGLVIICLYIALLPKILNFFIKSKSEPRPKRIKLRRRPKKEEVVKKEDDDIELITAIATAYYLDQDFMGDNKKITWDRSEKEVSLWRSAGLAQAFSTRNFRTRR